MQRLFPQIPLFCTVTLLLAAGFPGGISSAAGEKTPPSAAERRAAERAEFQKQIEDLDSPYYEVRRTAAERMEAWLGMPEMAAMLAEQFQQLVMQPELPFEVRWRIIIWRTRLPPAKPDPPQSVPADELERLVRQLNDDSYSVRTGIPIACSGWLPASPWPDR